MTTLSTSYRNWFILAVSLGGEWVISCLPPGSQALCTDWKIYENAEAALRGAQDYIDHSVAVYALADVILEFYEAGKIEVNECQSLLRSLGYF